MRIEHLTFLALLGFAAARPAGATNFVVVLLDDLGADKVGSYVDDMYPGYTPTEVADTPGIDALAASGLRFSTAWANPVCSPTRASLLTGRYAFQHDIGNIVTTSDLTLSEDEVTIPEMLGDIDGGASGYESALFGKWHLGLDTTLGTDWSVAGEVPEVAPPGLHGFAAYKGSLLGQVDDYYAWEETSWPVTLSSGASGSVVADSTEWASDPPFVDAADWIATRTGPWFVYLAINAPHSDATGDDDVWEDDDLAPEDGATCEDRDGDGACSSLENYLSLVSDADRRITDLLTDLMATDPALLEDTVIVVLGDNGSPADTLEGPWLPSGERDRAGKASMYESGVRVPFVLARGCDWMDAQDGALDGLYDGTTAACTGTTVPMDTPGRSVATPVLVSDVYATFAELAGSADAPPDASVSLVSCLESSTTDCPDVPDRAVYTERFVRPINAGSAYGRTGIANEGGFAVRQGDYKIIGTIDDSGATDCLAYEFYDLATDPYETDDLRVGDAMTEARQDAYDALWLTLRVDVAPDWFPARNCVGDSLWDDDGDGYEGDAHGGADCDDTDATISPGADEIWYDGIDQDCGSDSDYDQDGDGHAATTYGGDDCDDTAANVHPGYREVWYDGIDSNCDGRNDYDRDGDGYTASAYGGTDCNDTSATINPGRAEVWYNGVDQNCDGHDDYDQDFDGYRSSAYGGTDCNDVDATIHPGADEVWYDGIDQACDGSADDNDQDGDGSASADHGGDDCDDTDATTYVGAPDAWYDGVDSDCAGDDDFDQDADGFVAAEYGGDDCDDTDPTVHVGAVDVWYDGVDTDCAGDDDYDQDGDGFVAASFGGDDCDDLVATTYPGAADAWYDGIDADCAGDDDYDADGDGHLPAAYGGDDCDDTAATVYPGAADAWYDGVDADCAGNDDYDRDRDGYASFVYGGTDCADSNVRVHPGAPERWYDGVDQNCDGRDDYDRDGDGYASSAYGGTDCNDFDARVNPGAREVWYDGVDQNCDASDDYDADRDGYTSSAYGGPDCNDRSNRIHPGALELRGDGIDQNCNGSDKN